MNKFFRTLPLIAFVVFAICFYTLRVHASDYAFVGNNTKATLASGQQVPAFLAYSTNNSGSMVPLGSVVTAADTSFIGGNLYTAISGGPYVPALVLYTTDGAGGIKPVPGPGSGIAYSFGAGVPVATDRDGIAAAQQKGAAGNLTLNGAGVSGGTYAAGFDGGRKITVYSAGDLTTKTFTITGTDKDGGVQTESITGPNNATATGTKYFQTVTQVAVSASYATNAEIGFAASLVDLKVSRSSHFILNPANGETILIALYGAGGTNLTNRVSLNLQAPASSTITWADGSTPSDTRIYFKGGTELTPTASGTDWYEFEADGTTVSGDTVWYVVNQLQDLKP